FLDGEASLARPPAVARGARPRPAAGLRGPRRADSRAHHRRHLRQAAARRGPAPGVRRPPPGPGGLARAAAARPAAPAAPAAPPPRGGRRLLGLPEGGPRRRVPLRGPGGLRQRERAVRGLPRLGRARLPDRAPLGARPCPEPSPSPS